MLSDYLPNEWPETEADFDHFTDWGMARSGHRRLCTACRRPCKGHPGPTGKKCGVAATARRSGNSYEPNERTDDYPPLQGDKPASYASRVSGSSPPRFQDSRRTTPANSPGANSIRNTGPSTTPRPPINQWPPHDWDHPTLYATASSTRVHAVSVHTPVSSTPPIVSSAPPAVSITQSYSRPVASTSHGPPRSDYGPDPRVAGHLGYHQYATRQFPATSSFPCASAVRTGGAPYTESHTSGAPYSVANHNVGYALGGHHIASPLLAHPSTEHRPADNPNWSTAHTNQPPPLHHVTRGVRAARDRPRSVPP